MLDEIRMRASVEFEKLDGLLQQDLLRMEAKIKRFQNQLYGWYRMQMISTKLYREYYFYCRGASQACKRMLGAIGIHGKNVCKERT